MPAPGISYRLVHRVAGLGSLGHARYVAIADWHGGRIAREAKALAPSSNCWGRKPRVQKGQRPPGDSLPDHHQTMPSAVPIILSSCADAGLFVASLQTVPASNSLLWVARTLNFACSTPWDGKPPTSISAPHPRARPSFAISIPKKRDGSTAPPKPCLEPSARLGRLEEKKAIADCTRRSKSFQSRPRVHVLKQSRVFADQGPVGHSSVAPAFDIEHTFYSEYCNTSASPRNNYE